MTVEERTDVKNAGNVENLELQLETQLSDGGTLKASESTAFPILDGQEMNITLNNPSNQYTVYYRIFNQVTNTLFRSGYLTPGKSVSYMEGRSVGFNSYRIQNTSSIISRTGGQPFLGWFVIAQ